MRAHWEQGGGIISCPIKPTKVINGGGGEYWKKSFTFMTTKGYQDVYRVINWAKNGNRLEFEPMIESNLDKANEMMFEEGEEIVVLMEKPTRHTLTETIKYTSNSNACWERLDAVEIATKEECWYAHYLVQGHHDPSSRIWCVLLRSYDTYIYICM